MFQFAHIESYSRTTPKMGKAGAHSIASIIAEASRAHGSVPHINNPKLPAHLYGRPLEELERACGDWAETVKDLRGHRLRKDALCLLAGVISAPAEIDPKSWSKIRDDAIQWLFKKYGNRLHTVVEHVDEANPHIHFFCVPLPGERFDQIHDGKRAASTLRQNTKGAQNMAYRKAMREWQDEFSLNVGVPNGMARYGPRKRRLTRAAWKQEQQSAESIANSLALSQELSASIQTQANEALRLARVKVANAERGAVEAAEARVIDSFTKKNILAKFVEMITGLSKSNGRLRSDLEKLSIESKDKSDRAKAYGSQAKKYFDLLREIRPKYKELTETLGHIRIMNKLLSDDLQAEKEMRSEAEKKLSRALSTIKILSPEPERVTNVDDVSHRRSHVVREELKSDRTTLEYRR